MTRFGQAIPVPAIEAPLSEEEARPESSATYRWLRRLAPYSGRAPWLFYPVAAVVGTAAWYSHKDFRLRLTRNMLPFCDGNRRLAAREGRRAARNVARYWVDMTTLPHRNLARLERKHIRLVHGERLDAALAGGGPVIIVSAHMGAPEFCLQAIAARGRSFSALVENIQPPELGRYLLQLRSAGGGRFHPATISGVRAVFEGLEHGEVVGLLADRDLQRSGIRAELAGRSVRLPRGPWEIARRTGALVVPMFARRNWRDRWVVEVEEPFHVDRSADCDANIQDAATHFATLFEGHVRRQPGQWTVVEDFWRVHRYGKS